MDKQKSTGHYLDKTNNWLLFICLSGALAVGLGAFGAHALEGQLSPKRAEVYSTANFYHFIHTLLLLAVYLLGTLSGWNGKLLWAGKALGLGLFLFCGSLYFVATRGLLGAESAGWAGAITPIGGLAFIVAWMLIAFSFDASKSNV
jgi:uncharacterized membrane protein YgdD (TMEM256/DUF423 family)